MINNELLAEIKSNSDFFASIHHRSAAEGASKILGTTETKIEIFEIWETIGRSTAILYATLLTLNNSECGTAAKATIARSSLLKYILDDLKKEISKIMIVGAGATKKEIELGSISESVTYQLIGAMTQKLGYTSTTTRILNPIIYNKKIPISVEKDPKTTIQEVAQSKKFGTPIYKVIEITGKNDNQIFNVKLMTMGKSSFGTGKSKKNAEQAAARIFLDENFPKNKPETFEFFNEVNIKEISKSVHPLANNIHSLKIVKSLKIEDWASKLFSIAFTHSSYDLKYPSKLLGKNNTLLALIGSEVLQWAAKTSITNNFTPSEIKKSGGLAILSQKIICQLELVKIFDALDTRNLLQTGKGIQNLNQQTKVEFLQAYVGAIFLSHPQKVENYIELFEKCTQLKKHFIQEIKKFSLHKDEIISPKTYLQERSQSVAIMPCYKTQSRSSHGNIFNQPAITINSPWIIENLEIIGKTEITIAN